MAEGTYMTDVAITPDGHVLALVHEQVLPFHDLEALGRFIGALEAKKDACSPNIIPLDEETAKEAASEAIRFMEEQATGLSQDDEATDSRHEHSPQVEKGESMTPIMDTVLEFFEEEGWKFTKEDSVLRLPVTGQTGKWLTYAQAFEPQEQFVFYSLCPVNAPDVKGSEISEFLTRANYGLPLGNFEMDLEDGEIRYKTSIDVEGDRLVPSLVKQVVYSNLSIMDRYLPGIMKVIYGDVHASEAILEIES